MSASLCFEGKRRGVHLGSGAPVRDFILYLFRSRAFSCVTFCSLHTEPRASSRGSARIWAHRYVQHASVNILFRAIRMHAC